MDNKTAAIRNALVRDFKPEYFEGEEFDLKSNLFLTESQEEIGKGKVSYTFCRGNAFGSIDPLEQNSWSQRNAGGL